MLVTWEFDTHPNLANALTEAIGKPRVCQRTDTASRQRYRDPTLPLDDPMTGLGR